MLLIALIGGVIGSAATLGTVSLVMPAKGDRREQGPAGPAGPPGPAGLPGNLSQIKGAAVLIEGVCPQGTGVLGDPIIVVPDNWGTTHQYRVCTVE
ncbi:hypothetical protein [Streptomyces sp. NPDC058280]|uniref:hypothetical protein n=1 Tax=Streptomyces sp. NPDC058280 TaxID=3346419 RepID=UPI0036E1D998